MTGLIGVIPPDLVRYVLRVYCSGWSHGVIHSEILDRVAAHFILQTPENEYVSYRAVVEGILSYGFEPEHIAAHLDRLIPGTSIKIGLGHWLDDNPGRHAKWAAQSVGMWLQGIPE